MELKPETEELEAQLGPELGRIADKITDSLVSKLGRWLIRTTIGLTIAGVLWHFYPWGRWVFFGYILLASLSFAAILALHFLVLRSTARALECPVDDATD